MDLEALRLTRRKLALRKRRIIYNNDGDDAQYGHVDGQFVPMRPASANEFLARRTMGLENSHVDTISYCVVVGFRPTRHNTRVAGFAPPDGNEASGAAGARDHPDILIEGRDCLEIMIDFCRKNDKEIWASIRMNDNHDQWQIKERTPFRRDHPERWLAPPPALGGGAEEKLFLVSEGALEHPERWVVRGSCGCYYAADYEREDVRDTMFDIVEDLCGRYDIDGIELDYLRSPLYFRRNAEGHADAGQENRDKMTKLVSRIRKMTEKVGLERGRPLVIAARVPDDPDLSAACGLESRAWLEQGLVDILIAGGPFRIRPWKEFVGFAHNHGIPAYACVIDIGGTDGIIRGRALAAWAGGVDGVYTFNMFDPKSPLLNELGDPEKLREVDRITPVDNANVKRTLDHFTRLPDAKRFLKRPPRLPMELPEGEERTFEFTAGEDGTKILDSPTPHVALALRFNYPGEGDEMRVLLNEHELDAGAALRDIPDPGWIAFKDVVPFLRVGDNLLSLKLTKRDPAEEVALELADLKLHVTREPMQREVEKTCDAPLTDASGARLSRLAFLIAEDSIKAPCGKITGLRQSLLDALNFARPRVPGVYRFLAQHFDYPEVPIEKPLPGWRSLAVLFNAERMGPFCEKEMMGEFFRRIDSSQAEGDVGIHAGHLAGTWELAALVLRSTSEDNLEFVSSCFGRDCNAQGLMPFPIRFLRAEDDGHLIPRTFAIVFRGTLQDGVFTQAQGCWEKNLLREENLIGTTWRLGGPA